MTEAEWLGCNDPMPMLEFLRGKASDRKLLLFACACYWRVQHFMKADPLKEAVLEVLERYADGEASHGELSRVFGNCIRRLNMTGDTGCIPHGDPSTVARDVATFTAYVSRQATEPSVQCHLLRDIFGNPFRAVALDPSCFKPDLVQSANLMYEGRAFIFLASIANDLEGAGCTEAEILAHCRQPGLHVRGCWVVDLLTGRN